MRRALEPDRTFYRWRIVVGAALAFAFFSVTIFGEPARPAVYTPVAVKAAFLHRFASYVQWPEGALGEGPFTIGVVGSDEVAEQLKQILPDLMVQNRKAQVRKLTTAADVASIQILYIGSTHTAQSRSFISAAKSRPVLVVTDDEGGLSMGSVINFVRIGRNIRFEVSLLAAERNRLKIDSGLLSVAARVESSPRADATRKKTIYAVSKAHHDFG